MGIVLMETIHCSSSHIGINRLAVLHCIPNEHVASCCKLHLLLLQNLWSEQGKIKMVTKHCEAKVNFMPTEKTMIYSWNVPLVMIMNMRLKNNLPSPKLQL